jgi:hypothetical protein
MRRESGRNPEPKGESARLAHEAPATIGATATALERIAGDSALAALSAAVQAAQARLGRGELSALGSQMESLARETHAAVEEMAAQVERARTTHDSFDPAADRAAAERLDGAGSACSAGRLSSASALPASRGLGQLAHGLLRRAEALRSDMAQLVAALREA